MLFKYLAACSFRTQKRWDAISAPPFHWQQRIEPRYIVHQEHIQVIPRFHTSTANVIRVQSSACRLHQYPQPSAPTGQYVHVVVFAQTGQIFVVLIDTLLVGLYPLLGQALLHLLQPALLEPPLGLGLPCVRIVILFLSLLLLLLRWQRSSRWGAGGFGFSRGGLLLRLLFFLLLDAACNCAFELERAACWGESAEEEIGAGQGRELGRRKGGLYLSTRSPLFPLLLLWGRRFWEEMTFGATINYAPRDPD